MRTPDDSVCDNGDFCDGSETCDAAAGCLAGNAPNCNDGIGCTVDSCDEVGDICVNTSDNSLCDNGQFCDGAETCDPVLDCQSGAPPIIDDGVACTDDSCDEVNDIVINAVNNGNCDNGLFCDGMETCDPTLDCQAGPPPMCDDGVGCTVDSCDETNDTCVNTVNNAACDNGLFCDGVETCHPTLDCQVGTAPNCDDGITCTVDSCDEVGDSCVHAPSNAVCSNGQFCDGVETCDSALGCLPGPAVTCDDSVGCTVDTCDEVNDTCINSANDSLCNNGQFCDGVETCDASLDCQAGTPPNCSDGIGCTDNICDETNDVCVVVAVNANCDNGLFCDGLETCDPFLDCQPGTAPNCNDGVACTVDTCNESNDTCDNTPSDALCDNTQFCDGAETCDALAGCQAGTPLTCDDGVGCTADSCDEINDTCINAASNALCDNGLFCDGLETCDAINDCQAGTAPDCNDGVGCTVDACDEVGDTCVNTATDSLCDNGLFCDGPETCDPVNDCQAGAAPNCDDGVGCTDDSCDEDADVCVNAANNVNCDNGLFCDGAETCDPNLDCQLGTPVSCADGVGCTVDSCDETNDICVNALDDSQCDNGQFCDGMETCDALNDCQPGTAPDCGDGVGCTIESCDELNDVCVNTPDHSACDNGLFCDGAETCDAVNDCQPAVFSCDDSDACTTDSCDEGGDMCVNTPLGGCTSCIVDADCDDGITCTVDTCNAGVCVRTPDDSVCDNSQFCDGVETCSVSLGCQDGAPPLCDDGVACTVDSCDEINDTCTASTNDSLCANGQFCDGVETCHVTLGCQAGAPVDCNDAVACTVDACDEVADACSNVPNNLACDNGQFCDGAEVCDVVAGCVAGTPPNCDDGVSCTNNSCDEANDQCVAVALDSNCDNGAFCDGVETCDPVLDCQAGTPVNCDDGIACTVDACSEATDVCVNQADDALCDNGLFCDGAETCDAVLGCQAGPAPDCDDGVACTIDSCDEVGDACVNAVTNALCDNGQFCDGVETCDAVNDCQAGTPPVIDDGVGCTDDLCDEANDVVVHTANDANCNNGQYCDGIETCNATLDCQAGTPPNCNDSVGCTVDICDETNDVCVNTPNGSNCDNGQFCDGVETCDATLDCQPGTPPNCNDGVSCTVDTCDESGDSCVSTPTAALCDNGQFCDGLETCDAVNDCQAGTPPDCDDGVACTDDTCDEVGDACVNSANNANCDNGQFCDGPETCDTVAGCQAGTAPNCDDGVGCTDDSCDEVGDACVNAVNDSNCDNAQFCDGVETCDALNDCQPGTAPNCDDGVGCTVESCNETNDVCVNTPTDGLCNNGQFCDGVEFCDAVSDCQAGTPPNCDDGVGCTIDTCDEGSDICVSTSDDGLCDNGQFCDGFETCDPVLDCQAGTAPALDDGVACTDDSCDEVNDIVVNAPNDANCDNGLFCDGVETCDAANDCLAGVDPCAAINTSCDEVLDLCADTCIFDCNLNTAVDTGDYSYFLGCFGTLINPGDFCECADYNGNGAGDTGDYAGLLGCFGEFCPCPSGGPAPDFRPAIAIEVVLRAEASDDDHADALPAGLRSVSVGQTFVAEVWASAGALGVDELACAAADIVLGSAVEILDASASETFALLSMTQPDARRGTVANVGGCVSPEQRDMATGADWVRIGIIDLRARESGVSKVGIGGPSSPFAGTSIVGSSTNVDPSSIEYGRTRVRVRPGEEVGSRTKP